MEQSPSGGMVWRFIGTEGGNDEPKKKRAKRLSTAALACEMCRLKHKKCDGEQPDCGRCAKRGEECIYVVKRRKRGPAKKRLEEEAEAFLLAQGTGNAGTTTLLLENHLCNAFGFSSFLQRYEEHVHVYASTPPATPVPARDYQSFQSLQDPARLMLMNVILATGAQLSGNMKCANEYFSRASNLMKEMYNETNAIVAASHTMMVFHYELRGEVDKAIYANSTALQIMKYLARTRPQEVSKDGVHYPSIMIRCLSGEVASSNDPVQQNRMIRQVITVPQRLGFPEEVCSIFKIVLEMVMLCNDAQSSPPEHVKASLGLYLEYATKIQYLTSAIQPTGTQRVISSMTRILCAVYLRVGMLDESLAAADELLACSKKYAAEHCDMTYVSAVFCAAQTYIRAGRAEQYAQSLHVLSKLAETAPVARSGIVQLERMKETVDALAHDPDAIARLPVKFGWTWDLIDPPQQRIGVVEDARMMIEQASTVPSTSTTLIPNICPPSSVSPSTNQSQFGTFMDLYASKLKYSCNSPDSDCSSSSSRCSNSSSESSANHQAAQLSSERQPQSHVIPLGKPSASLEARAIPLIKQSSLEASLDMTLGPAVATGSLEDSILPALAISGLETSTLSLYSAPFNYPETLSLSTYELSS